MPSNKSQHFVPRTHFKPFSLGRQGKAINLFNISSEKAVQNAAVAGQCSQNYFYGEAPTFEEGLQYFETRYGAIVGALEQRTPLSKDDHYALRIFVLFQLARTEAAARTARATFEGGYDRMFPGEWASHRPPQPSNREMVLLALATALEARDVVDDLKMCVFQNTTELDFITTDNPAVAANRWSWQRLKDHGFGLASSGLFLSLPLSPRMSLCYYDSGTYSCTGEDPVFRPLRKRRDVEALNELQILNAVENVYFSDWSSREDLRDQIAIHKPRRSSERVAFNVYVKDEAGKDAFHGKEAYRLATEEEVAQPIPKLVMNSRVYPVPTRWPSSLKIRSRPRVFSNGSAAGYLRDPERLGRRLGRD